MAQTYKVLGQSMPAGGVLTTLYTVPGSTSVVNSSVVACNQGEQAAKISITVAVAGAADTPSQYLLSNLRVPGNEPYMATIGITLGAADVVRVRSDTGNVSFNMFGSEVT